jgi:uncharacterized membrane protein
MCLHCVIHRRLSRIGFRAQRGGYFALDLAGYIIAAFSVPFTIVQAYRSALEQQQLFERERKDRDAADRQVFSETPRGRVLGALSQLRTEMHMDSQEPHS